MMSSLNWQVISVAAVVVTAVWCLGWWLRGQLQSIRDSGERRTTRLQEAIEKKYDDHEQKDQMRHESNLSRFASSDTRLGVIETKLNMLLNGRGSSH